ncbi:hypothetical protein SLEP1_g49214 [Rubroshorea leprosula]|uniref:Endonuclease/exonuclease/phosphatase domain-containing protein n=1 Tax=Rubroshorea leprosula TaxID=152421 RepID=A0AAV5LWD9_9ROSI|nr:hypothetical protein SLEP1_g49214 [Rubroshorea leprosula]
MDTIKVSRQVKINGNLYNMKFSEEEVSNCFFSLKQDFLPSFQSDEEDCESWSIGTVMETQECHKAKDDVLCHEKHTHEEDDDVAWEGIDQDQPTKEEEKLGEATTGNPSQSQIQIQILNRERNRATCNCLEKENEVIEPVYQAEDEIEEDGEEVFWRGFKKDKGRVEAWINKQIMESAKDGKVAGGSVGDSGTLNCNRSIKNQLQSQKIEEMERRDSRMKGEMANPETEGAKKIREIVMKEKVDFIAIQETKLVTVDRKICRIIWGTDDFDWVAKPSVGRSRGLLCIWNTKVLKKMEVIEGNNFIRISRLWGEERIPVNILNIYSLCQLMGKRMLWDDLQGLLNSKRRKWCLMGDFNAVRGIEERAGETGISSEMREFDNFIINAALIDLPLLGRKYTWYNSNGQYMSRIDRFLLSEDWVAKWGDVKQWGLRRSVSDHCPILLKNEKIDWGPKLFKFFDAWFDKPGCKELITRVWKTSDIQGQKGFILKEKLKSTKKALKEWSRNLAQDVDAKVKEAEAVIVEIDEKGENSQLTAEDVERRRGSFMVIWKNLRIKERMWQQKARRMWFKEGDANTNQRGTLHECEGNKGKSG